MAVELYSTAYLSRVVESLLRTPAFFLNMFFTEIETSDTETIYFDIEKEGTRRRLAPFVHPLVEGVLVESQGFETKSFKPAYIKDKRVHDASRPFKRSAGEAIGTGQTLNPTQRRELAIRRDLRDQVDMLTRRLETMAIEAIVSGTETIAMLMNDGTEKEVVLNFGRAASQTIVLTGAARWGQTDVEPMNSIEDAALDTLQLSGSSVRTLVFDTIAWKSFKKNSVELDRKLDLRRAKSGEIDLTLVPDHVSYKGSDGTFDYWVYADWYYNPGTDAEVPMLPAGTVLGIGDVMGVRHFGAIKDEAAGFMAMEYFTKSWTIEDPSARLLLMQSAPAIVPYRPNATFAITIDGGA
jgi:hypothetical protein